LKRPQQKLGTMINRGTTLVAGPSSRLSIVSDSEVIFTCRLTSTVSALAVVLLHAHGLAAHLCKDFTRGYCPRHSLLFSYHAILQMKRPKVKGIKAIQLFRCNELVPPDVTNYRNPPPNQPINTGEKHFHAQIIYYLTVLENISIFLLKDQHALCKIMLNKTEISAQIFPSANCFGIQGSCV